MNCGARLERITSFAKHVEPPPADQDAPEFVEAARAATSDEKC
jgi:hypothetical protein